MSTPLHTPWAGQDLRGRMLVLRPVGALMRWHRHRGVLLPLPTSNPAHKAALAAYTPPESIAKDLRALPADALCVLRQTMPTKQPQAADQAELRRVLRSGTAYWPASLRLTVLDLLDTPDACYALRLLVMREAMRPWGYREQLEDPHVVGIARDTPQALALLLGQLQRPCVAGVLAHSINRPAPGQPAEPPWLITQRTAGLYAGPWPAPTPQPATSAA